MTDFKTLEARLPEIMAYQQPANAYGFFLQELLRFISIAGTLKNNFSLGGSPTMDERYITHPLIRSLLENFFVVMYLFDDPAQTSARYDELKYSFSQDYQKLITDLAKPAWQPFMQGVGSALQQPQQVTAAKKLPGVEALATAIRNVNGQRLNYLYPLFRITSFDTHGRSLATIFDAVFNKQNVSFPVIRVDFAIDMMAEEYDFRLSDLVGRTLVQ